MVAEASFNLLLFSPRDQKECRVRRVSQAHLGNRDQQDTWAKKDPKDTREKGVPGEPPEIRVLSEKAGTTACKVAPA